jgi:hypothetical protein
VKFDANATEKQQAESVEPAACLLFILDLGVAYPEIPLVLNIQCPAVVQQDLVQVPGRTEQLNVDLHEGPLTSKRKAAQANPSGLPMPAPGFYVSRR